MKHTIPFPAPHPNRKEYLKSAGHPHRQRFSSHAPSHTRGDLPGRMARNWKAVAASAQTTGQRTLVS